MRIGVDTRLLYFRQAGISWYTRRLLTALAQVDRENEYLLLQHRRHHEPIINAANFRRFTLYAPAHHRLEQALLSLETRRLRLDLIHSPDFIPPLYNRVPAVITVHDLAFLLNPNFVTTDAARYYGQTELAVRRASRIIAPSQSTRLDLIRLLGAPEAKIDVIYEAADPIFQPLVRQDALLLLRLAGLPLPDQVLEGGFLLFVGTIEPRKNLSTLLRAYQQLRQMYQARLPLVLAGAEGWLFADILDLVGKLGLSDHVHFTGPIATNEQLAALYNLAVCLVHPAHYEGFGLTPLEAMACGAPVICSQAGSLPEVVDDAALLALPTDVDAWAAAMQRLIEDEPLRADLRTRGLARAATFSWRRAAEETLATYQQAVAL